MTTVDQVTVTLLPKYENFEVVKPGERTGKGGNPHHYLIDGVKHTRVTTVLDQTIPKPGLIYWAKNVALDKFEATLLEHKDLEPYQLTTEGIATLKEFARNRPDEIKDEAADWGTRAHGVIQNYITNTVADFGCPYQFAPTITAFKEFSDSLSVQWVATEMTVWDDELKVAGTVDAIGWSPKCTLPCSQPAFDVSGEPWHIKNSEGKYIIPGEICPDCKGEGTIISPGWVIADWKTGKSCYPEHALQLSAYAAMFEKITGNKVAEAYVVRFPKDQPERDPCPTCENIDPTYNHTDADGEWVRCDTCQGEGYVPAPSFEVQKVADLARGWERYRELVKQREYVKNVWG